MIGVKALALLFDPIECIGCGACEVVCGFQRDDAFTLTSSSIIVYRAEEKRNYFGLLYKTKTHMITGRPEGVQRTKLGEASPSGGGAGGKEILIRPACSECAEAPCVRICPTGAIEMEDN